MVCHAALKIKSKRSKSFDYEQSTID